MDFEFETTRTGLANAFAAAGAELLGYMDIVSTAVAAIPDTQPQKYAIAGTLPGILQMAGKMMGEDAATPAVEPVAWMRRNLKECKTDAEVKHMASLEFGCWKEIAASYTIPLYAAPAHPVSAAEKPTDDLTYEQIMENYRELGGETWGQSQQAVADAFRNHVGAIATDDAAGPYVKFRFRSMADADAALESIIASFSLPVSQEGAHAALDTSKMREMLDVQGQSGTWNYNHYMHGMYNGMEYMLAMVENREPAFRDAPADWLSDRLKPEAMQTQAARDVLAERRRQIESEGWTPNGDDKYRMSELSTAAACYALTGNADARDDVPQIWPWAPEWWKPAGDRRNLVKAGALILAEIERLDRASIQTPASAERSGDHE